MRRITLRTLAAVAVATTGSLPLLASPLAAQDAQAAAPATAGDGAWLESVKGRLKLTPEQEASLRPILEEEVGKLKALRAKYEGQTSRKAKRAKLKEAKAIQSDAQNRINPLLTEEQRAEWKKIRDETRAKAKEEMKKRRAAGVQDGKDGEVGEDGKVSP